MSLSNIARYTELAIRQGLYMTETISYKTLVAWYEAAKAHTSKMRSTNTAMSIHESKYPSFQVAGFVGDTLQGYLFEQKVISVFGNNAMAAFLNLKSHCDNHPA